MISRVWHHLQVSKPYAVQSAVNMASITMGRSKRRTTTKRSTAAATRKAMPKASSGGIITRQKKALEEDFPALKGDGYIIRRIGNDGNCLFRAMSDQLFGREEDYIKVRKAAVDQMRIEPHEYTPFIDYRAKGMSELRRGNARGSRASSYTSVSLEELSPTVAEKADVWEAYLIRTAKNREWGDHLEIKAIARAYNVDVKVYIQAGVQNQHLGEIVLGGEHGIERPVARIAFHGWRHFSSARLPTAITGEPAIVCVESFTRLLDVDANFSASDSSAFSPDSSQSVSETQSIFDGQSTDSDASHESEPVFKSTYLPQGRHRNTRFHSRILANQAFMNAIRL